MLGEVNPFSTGENHLRDLGPDVRDGDHLVIPSGRRAGCLPRESKVGQWCPLASEHIEIIPRQEWASLIGDGVSMRPRVNMIKDQDGVGSCATESTTQGVEIARDMAGFKWVQLNPWFIYHSTSGGSDRGSSIDANLRFVRENGIAPESVWPRSKGWRSKPSSEAYEAAKEFKIEEFYDITSIDEVGSCLLKGFAVVFGWSGHSVIYTRLLDSSTGEYANSWSTRWGDEGFGKLALRSVNWGYGAYAIRVPQMNAPLP